MSKNMLDEQTPADMPKTGVRATLKTELNLHLKERTDCPGCGSDRSHFEVWTKTKEVTRVNFYPHCTWILCSLCGLIFQSLQLLSEDTEEYYREAYRPATTGSNVPTRTEVSAEALRGMNILKFFHAEDIVPKRLLDFGSSCGSVLELMRRHFGARVIGVEINANYAGAASRAGYPTYLRLDQVPGKFDTIILSHVLEHMNDPIDLLIQLRDRLDDGGKIYVEIPQLYAGNALRFSHPTAFTKNSLLRILEAGGLKPIWSKIHGSPTYRFVPLYISVICAKADIVPGKLGIGPRPSKLHFIFGNWWLRRYTGLLKWVGRFHHQSLARLLGHPRPTEAEMIRIYKL